MNLIKLTFHAGLTREENPLESAVGVHLNPESLQVVGAVGSFRELVEGQEHLVPTLGERQRELAREGFHLRLNRQRRHSEPSANVVVVEYLNVEGKRPIQIFHGYHENGKLDSECFLDVSRTRDVRVVDFVSGHLEHQTLHFVVQQTFHVTVADFFIPQGKGLFDGAV